MPADMPADMPEGAARTPGEKTAVLDRELDESLEEFDDLLARQREAQERRRASASGAPAGGGSGGLGTGTSSGDAGSEEGDEASGGENPYTGEGAVGQSEPGGRRPEAEAPEGEDSGETAEVPPDVGTGDDDDIVARQIREAAMKEEDPELREKLWDEYRAYKKGQARKDD